MSVGPVYLRAVAVLCAAVVAFPLSGQEPTQLGQVDIEGRKTRISAYPYVFYTPETEFALGAGGIVTFYTSRRDSMLRPSKVTASGYYSTRKQYKLSLVPVVYFAQNRWLATAPIDFGQYVDKFWGVGNATGEIETEDYKTETFQGRFEVQAPPPVPFVTRVGLIYDLQHVAVTDKLENPFLADTALVGTNGGTSSGLGLGWTLDSRDHTFFPNRGHLQQVKVVFFFPEIGSDFGFTTIEADLRFYWQLGEPDRVLAAQAYGSFVTGSPPFYRLPALGGQNRMRGYFYGRYRDESLITAQVEYRMYVWRRLGIVAFAGVGEVFGSPESDAVFREFKQTIGFGLRYKFNVAEKVNLRADFGFGRHTSGVYFGLEEAF